MSLPVVTVTRSWSGRVTVKWFTTEAAMSRDAWTARATSRIADIRGEHTSQDCLVATCTRSLLADGADVSWRATHRRGRRLVATVTA
ncbi:MAG TPA: hypothetical protein VJ976_02090 [Ornithinimicrobium sp.]|uniref:hypothetical protein n=1 Tax=Ornithinimicrobium sp. TaxID=1977084 RepID=UPI002B459C16|nr:hypothetical protein [Ornithinimicrobium sp.]HKJ11159.1 hypothetical protein [Ornithinimicrobium sp.]